MKKCKKIVAVAIVFALLLSVIVAIAAENELIVCDSEHYKYAETIDDNFVYTCVKCNGAILKSSKTVMDYWTNDCLNADPSTVENGEFLDVVPDNIINAKDYAKISRTTYLNTKYSFNASVYDDSKEYHNGDTIQIKKDTVKLISFGLTDSFGEEYVTGWYSDELVDAGFIVSLDPIIMDDTYYALINASKVPTGTKSKLIIKGFTQDVFNSEEFDWGTTPANAEFEIYFEVV